VKLLSGYCVRYRYRTGTIPCTVRCFGQEQLYRLREKEETLCTRKTTLSYLLVLSEEKKLLAPTADGLKASGEEAGT
jgi:hypothetical protein